MSLRRPIKLTFHGKAECHHGTYGFFLRTGKLEMAGRGPALWLTLDYHKRCRRGVKAPLALEFHTPEDLRTLICGLAKALAQMTTTREEEV